MMQRRRDEIESKMAENDTKLKQLQDQLSQKVSKFNQESIDKEQELLLYKREIESKFERKQDEWEEERKSQRKDLFEREESLQKAMAEFKMSMDMQRHESEMKIRSESLALQNKEGNIKHKEDELQITESKIREDLTARWLITARATDLKLTK